MKTYLNTFLILIVLIIITYLLEAFTLMTLNTSLWTKDERVIFVGITIYLFAFFPLIKHELE